MRTNIVIDDELMQQAMTLSRLKTKKAVVETGSDCWCKSRSRKKLKVCAAN